MQANIISQKYGNREILHNLELTTKPAEVVGIIGANGCGKSTLLKVLLGQICNFTGNIDLQGQTISGFSEMPKLDKYLSGRETLEYLLGYKLNEFDDNFQITPYIDKKIRTYSLGMKQRLVLTYIFMRKTDIIILDEPINGLDVDGIDTLNRLLKLMKAEDRTVIITSHILDYLENLIDVAYFLVDGALVTNVAKEITYIDYELEFADAGMARDFATTYGYEPILNSVYLSIEPDKVTATLESAIPYRIIQAKKINALKNEYDKVVNGK